MFPAMKLQYLFAAFSATALAAPAPSREPCPLHKPDGVRLVENTYMVKLKANHTLDDHFAHIGKNLSAQAGFTYLERINFYHAVLDDETLHDRVRLDPGVELTEHDQYIDTPENVGSHQSIELRDSFESPNLQRRLFGYVGTEEVDTYWWHSQITIGKKMNPIMSSGNAYNFKGAGLGVDIYVLDSGIYNSHSAFSGRATNFRGLENSKYTGGPATDYDGHGTHVASIAAKVAPNANIINVKVTCKRVNDAKNGEPLCKSGTAGGLARAISDITDDHVAKKKNKSSSWKGSVINISGGQGSSSALGEAIQAAAANGIPMATAAGNTNNDQVYSTCGNKNTMCVANTKKDYSKGLVSNYGKYVGIVAPGDYIMGADLNGIYNYTTKMGTSQATPQVAGAMAIFIGQEGLNGDKSDVQAVYKLLILNSITNIVTGFDSNTQTNFLNTGIKNPKKGYQYPFLVPETELKARDGEKTLTQASVAATATAPKAASTAAATSIDAPVGPGYALENIIASANPTEPAFYQVTWTAPAVYNTATSAISDMVDDLSIAATATA